MWCLIACGMKSEPLWRAAARPTPSLGNKVGSPAGKKLGEILPLLVLFSVTHVWQDAVCPCVLVWMVTQVAQCKQWMHLCKWHTETCCVEPRVHQGIRHVVQTVSPGEREGGKSTGRHSCGWAGRHGKIWVQKIRAALGRRTKGSWRTCKCWAYIEKEIRNCCVTTTAQSHRLNETTSRCTFLALFRWLQSGESVPSATKSTSRPPTCNPGGLILNIRC